MNIYTGTFLSGGVPSWVCHSIQGCIGGGIFNLGQDSFWGFFYNLKHYLFNVAMDQWVLNAITYFVFFMLFLFFIVGFIFFVRK